MLNNPSRSDSRRPGPLEVEASQLSGHIHRLADKEQPRYRPRLHRPRLQSGRVYSSGRHLCFIKSFGSHGMKLPSVQIALASLQSCVGPARRASYLGKQVCQTLWENCTQHLP